MSFQFMEMLIKNIEKYKIGKKNVANTLKLKCDLPDYFYRLSPVKLQTPM